MEIPFIQCQWQTIAHREDCHVIVIHTMEVPLQDGMAMRVAEAFQNGYHMVDGKLEPHKVSAHYCVDTSQIVQCCHEYNVAWHCPGANRRGIGVEHSGYADKVDWNSPEADAELRLSAGLVAGICKRWDIPVVHLSVDELRGNARGLIGHVDATIAFATPGGHRDPGQSFPWAYYLGLVGTEFAKP